MHRLVHVLSEAGRFAGWPITALLEERSLFYRFLQERWPIFLDKKNGKVIDSDVPLSVSGPIDIPFDDPDVRVYIDNLFVEGLLQPVEWSGVPEAWALAGVRNDPQFTRERHFEALLDITEREMPGSEARHGEWLSFARIWAEVNLLSSEIGTASSSAMLDRFTRIRARIDSCFCEWVQKRIGSLSSLPASPPVMVHHVARFLSNQLETAGNRRRITQNSRSAGLNLGRGYLLCKVVS